MSRVAPFKRIRPTLKPRQALEKLVGMFTTREAYEAYLAKAKHPGAVRALTEPMLRPELRDPAS